MGGGTKCRLWWPIDVSRPPADSSFLFGWFFPSSRSSFDVVVAFCCNEMVLVSSGHGCFDFQGVNEAMPSLLRQKSKFSLLGHCEADSSDNLELTSSQNGKANGTIATRTPELDRFVNNCERWSCGCLKHEGKLRKHRILALENFWMKLVPGYSDSKEGRVPITPKVDHVHFNNNVAKLLDLHAVNTVSAARILFGQHLQAESSLLSTVAIKSSTFAWKAFALSVASFSTIVYIILQDFYTLFFWSSCLDIDNFFAEVMSNALKNVHFRCCQFLHWPIFLEDQNLRDYSCIEFAEKAEMKKHFIWSNSVVDILLGNLLGFFLWFMADAVYLIVSSFADDFTNNWLRTGSVWLMGNPAGFKLNTELAGVFGMISLNAIQIWFTLADFMAVLFLPFTKGLALCGIFFGLTSAAALVVDMISLATMHVSTLRAFFALIYFTQIQALAALWRLFRGRKWNPLQNRLESYDYTVDQHVVGSLLFTPILLLLPTTTAFYIFFTISHLAIIFICVLVEAAISVFHCTPFAKIFLWLKRRQRFPSGIWFNVLSSEIHSCRNSSHGSFPKVSSPSTSDSSILLTHLRSNYLSLRDLISPHYSSLCSSYSKSCILSVAHALLSGRSIPSTPGLVLPMELQWIVIPWKEYWRLCYDAAYACKPSFSWR